MTSEVKASLTKMKNGKEADKYPANIETLKAENETIAKDLAALYTNFITERRISKTWMGANAVIFFQERVQQYIKNYFYWTAKEIRVFTFL